MLVVRYVKTGGAQFISHLDTMRHLQKTLIRAKIPVEYSKGFNPHMLIFLSAPIGVGLKSESEYFFLETSEKADVFLEKFNNNCPVGLKADQAFPVGKNPNLQALIDSAEYFIETDIGEAEVEKILSSDTFTIVDKKGVEREVRSRVISLKKVDNGLIARLSFGNETLRADIFAEKLKSITGNDYGDIIKLRCYVRGEEADEYIRKNFPVV